MQLKILRRCGAGWRPSACWARNNCHVTIMPKQAECIQQPSGWRKNEVQEVLSAEVTLKYRKSVWKHRENLSPSSTELKDTVEGPGVMLQESVWVAPCQGEITSHRQHGHLSGPCQETACGTEWKSGACFSLSFTPCPPQPDSNLVYSCPTRKAAYSLFIFLEKKRKNCWRWYLQCIL